MKIRRGYAQVQSNIDKLISWFDRIPKDEVYAYKDIFQNVLRVLSDEKFHKDILNLRKKINLPELENLESDPDEKGVIKWQNKNQSAPQYSNDMRLVNLCIKYRLDPIRYSEFVYGYLYYGSIETFLPFKNNTTQVSNEARFKTKIECVYEGTNNPKAGYIRFYKDTTINQIKEFVDTNGTIIKKIQASLPECPLPHSHHMGTFALHMRIFLLYLNGKTDREISDQIQDETKVPIEWDAIRKIINEMKKVISNSNSFDTTSVEYLDSFVDQILYDWLFSKA